MRVIAGEERGRRLRVPRGRRVRPALGRVKVSLFDILVSRGLVQGERILDVFAGSGSLGIEALSRGAAWVVFVECDRVAGRVLRANVAAGHMDDRASVVMRSSVEALPRLAHRGEVFDGVFVDPPYGTPWMDRTLRHLGRGPLVQEGGWVAAHYRRGEEPASNYGSLTAAVWRHVGDAGLVLYRRQAE